MTCHSGENAIAFGAPSANSASHLSASSEPLLHTISRSIYGGEECATFDTFPDDLPLGGINIPDLMLIGQVGLSYGLGE